jgi:hypothetical protein
LETGFRFFIEDKEERTVKIADDIASVFNENLKQKPYLIK